MRAAPLASAPVEPLTLVGVAGLWAWWDATQITPVADGTAVAQWNDMSGAARHPSQNVSSLKRPLYKTAILNAKPVVQFDGTDDYMTIAQVLGQAGADLSIIAVVKGTAADKDVVSTRAAWTGWLLRQTATGMRYANLSATNYDRVMDSTAWNNTGSSATAGSHERASTEFSARPSRCPAMRPRAPTSTSARRRCRRCSSTGTSRRSCCSTRRCPTRTGCWWSSTLAAKWGLEVL